MQGLLRDAEEKKQGVTLSYKLDTEGVLEPKNLKCCLNNTKEKYAPNKSE